MEKRAGSEIDGVDRVTMLLGVGVFAAVALLLNPELLVLPEGTEVYEVLATTIESIEEEAEVEEVLHMDTPEPLKALYMTSWVAGTPGIRERVIKLVEETEANALVIDIKDDTGKISFLPNDPYLQEIGAGEDRIADIDEFFEELHEKGIYIIGRVSVFQDPHLVKVRPDLAVRRASTGEVWGDRKGLTWLDAGASEVWDYVIAIARESYSRGFDEINFDYIRYPSDGDTDDISYPFAGDRPRHVVMGEFYSYLGYELQDDPFPISADLFGMVTTERNDMGIGQLLEVALPHFDYIAPMVYPSHFGPGVYGVAKPAEEPYAIIHHAMSTAVARAIAASSTPAKLRPWLQDFDLGAVYTADMVRAQIQATYDAGLTSWMMWDPSNRYTRGGLLSE